MEKNSGEEPLLGTNLGIPFGDKAAERIDVPGATVDEQAIDEKG